MNFAFFIYLAHVLPSVGMTLWIVSIAGFIGLLIGAGAAHDTLTDAEAAAFWKYWRRCAVAVGMAAVGGMVIPSERTIYMMAGAHFVQKAVESPEAQGVNDKLLKLLHGKLDAYISEQTGGKK